jgi:fimbrial isopeptide formation D2 family protein
MKRLYPFLLLLATFHYSHAQLTADAGPDLFECFGGTVILGGSPTATNGTAPYTYNWSTSNWLNFPTQPNPLAVVQITTLYYLTVTDAVGDTAVDSVLVTAFPPPMAQPFINNVTCFGGADGMIDLVVTGGLPPYTYQWSNGSTAIMAGNLSAGTYSVTITDALNCSAFNSFTINQPAELVAIANTVGESQPGLCDGSVVLSVSGGTAPYSYVWSNASTVPNPGNLCPGVYTVTVVDANGCSSNTIANVASNCPVNTLSATITSQDLSCTHEQDTLTVNISGGTAPYYVNWNNGVSGSNQIIVDMAGIWTAFIIDTAGCTLSVSDTLLDTGVVIVPDSFSNAACDGISNGAIALHATGGTPPYSYAWSHGPTTASVSGLSPGFYTVTVTDVTLCSAEYSRYIGQGSLAWSFYAITGTTPVHCGSPGTAWVSAYGGTPPYTYLWSTTPAQSSDTITGLAAGAYSVTVQDASGCERVAYAEVYSNCFNTISGVVFQDANGNCIKDTGEAVLPYVSLTATNGNQSYYGYSNSNGQYTVYTSTTGNFTVTASINNGWASCSNVSVCGAQTINFATLGDSATLNFGFGASSGHDLSLHPGWTSANPGFQKEYWILYHQQSLPAYTGPATITFKYDSILVYQSHTLGGTHNAAARTITWNVSSVPYPMWDWNLAPRSYFTVPANTPVGYQLKQEFWITPVANDCDSSDNHLLYIQPVTGSMDPNEKQVQPAGDIYDSDSVLTYTIHFQNTGNDTTYFIYLIDTLSSHLEPATVVNLASSHDYQSFDISEQGILTWRFVPIFLVDSATNEPASKGFVTFKVKKKSGLVPGTVIRNSASIYFDYNEPIRTNTVSTQITLPSGVLPDAADGKLTLAVVPNPFTDETHIFVRGGTSACVLELYSSTGQLLRTQTSAADGTVTLQRGTLAAGLYYFSLRDAAGNRATGKVSVR